MTIPFRVGLSSVAPADTMHPLERAVWAEANGYDGYWIADTGNLDALTLAAGVAARTESLRVCLAIVPAFTRPAAVLATSAMTLNLIAPRRIVLGLGASHKFMVEEWFGIPYRKPLTRVRETAQLVRRMLAGEAGDFEGDTIYSRKFKLATPPAEPVPIYLAALRPKMLELAGEIADGVILNLAPVAALPRMLEHIDTGAKRSGRRVEDLEIASVVNVFVTGDAERARRDFRAIGNAYYAMPAYNQFLEWSGFSREAQRIRDAIAAGEGDAAAALSDDVVEQLVIIGDADQCRAALNAYRDAGLNTAIVRGPSSDPAVHRASIEAFAGRDAG